MQYTCKKLLSLLLVITMLISTFPMQIFAYDDTETTTLYMPIEASSDEEFYLPTLFSVGDEPIYANTTSTNVELPDMKLSFTDGDRVQAIDSTGNVVAQTTSIQSNHVDTLYFFDSLPVGEYQLQRVTGDYQNLKTEKLNYLLNIVDSPVIIDARINTLNTGTTPSTLTLTLAGYDGNPDAYKFALTDDNMNTIPCTAMCEKVTDNSYNQSTSIKYVFTPSQALIAGTKYYLEISANGTLYSNVSSVSKKATTKTTNSIAILEIKPNNSVIGGLVIKVGGVTANKNYNITASTSNYAVNSDEILFESSITPVMSGSNGIFYVNLTRNGIQLPLYSYENIYVDISDDMNVASDSYYFSGAESQFSRLSLEKTGYNAYSYKLEACNMLLDVYEASNPVFILKRYDSTLKKYINVSTNVTITSKNTYNKTGSTYYEFNGNITTSSALADGISYRLDYNNTSIASTKTVKGENGNLRVTSVSFGQFDYDNNSFYANLDMIPVNVTLANSASVVTAQLYDKTANTVVSTSKATQGVSGDNGYVFDFLIPMTTAINSTHKYDIHIVSGNETISLGEYSSSYSDMTYDSNVVIPNRFYMNSNVYEGDTSLLIDISEAKNIPSGYFINNPLNIVNIATETGLIYTSSEIYLNNYNVYAKLNLSEPIKKGNYRIFDDQFVVYSSQKEYFGSAKLNTNNKIEVINCSNLNKNSYNGILYNTASPRAKIANLTFTKTNNSLTSNETVTGIVPAGYSLEIWSGDEYIGAKNFTVSETPTDTLSIIGYDPETYDKIVYQTSSSSVYLMTILSGYSQVRYSENRAFSGVNYAPIKSYSNQEYTLSSGNGVKTIYVQFKNSAGRESAVYSWSCEKVQEIKKPEILDAYITVNGNKVDSAPVDSDFTLNVVLNSKMASTWATLYQDWNGDGIGDYDEQFALSYVGETSISASSVGYVFQETFFNEEYSPYVTALLEAYDFNNEDTPCDDMNLSLYSADTGITLDNWKETSDLIINKDNITITGTATPDSTVNISLGMLYESAICDNKGNFSITFTDLDEDSYYVYADDDEGLYYDGYATLVVDYTAPRITSIHATLGDNGNAAVTWSCQDSSDCHYLLYRDDVLIKGSETSEYEKFIDTNYIAANAAGSVFKVVAIDIAGNKSQPVTTNMDDDESPSVPGTPTLTAHGTKSISLKWDKATDNVAVYKYKIYRDDTEIATVPYTTLSFKDENLTENTDYTYKIYALDRAENISNPATATLSTATLSIKSTSQFEEKYIKELTPNGINVELNIDFSDALYDIGLINASLKYKKEDATEWSTLSLAKASSNSSRHTGTLLIEDLESATYDMKFYVVDTEGTEKETLPVKVIISHDTVPPTVSVTSPKNDTLGGKKAINVSFKSSDNVEMKKVDLYYSTDEGNTWTKFKTANVEEKGTTTFNSTVSFEEAATLPSGIIFLKAKAYDLRDNEGESEAVSFKLDNTPPSTPFNFYAGGDKDKISVIWEYPDQAIYSDFSKFNVYRAVSVDGDYTCVSSQKSINYYDTVETGINKDTAYYYYVTAVDKYGNESNPTIKLSAQLIDDNESPEIHGVMPSANDTLIKSTSFTVSATDNYLLNKCVIEYKKDGTNSWTTLTTLSNEYSTRSHIYTYDWNLNGVPAGKYNFRISVYDQPGNEPAVNTFDCNIKEYTEPVSPVLSASSNGHKSIGLSWTYGGDASLVKSYTIYRSSNGVDFDYVTSVKSTTTTYTDTLKFTGESANYKYYITVNDNYDANKNSNTVSAQAVSSDTEKPVPVINPDNLAYVEVNTNINFSAKASKDNDEIVSYEWNFGDGNTSNSQEVSHTYTAVGDYTVTLKVTDAYGNFDTTTSTVKVVDLSGENPDYTKFDITVCDATTTNPVANAQVIVKNTDSEETFTTDANGKVSCVVPNGGYIISVCSDDYIIRTVTVEAKGGVAEHTIGLTNGSIIGGELTAKELTYDEIIAAGIDPNAEGNQHVFKFAATLTFVAGPSTYTLPYEIFKNANGKYFTGGGSGGGGFLSLAGSGGSGSGGGGGLSIGIFPITENFALVIYGEARWLKEMYKVELVVFNKSQTDTLENVKASIDLPAGLSLADMVSGKQDVIQDIGTVTYDNDKNAVWYVRGDQAGEYKLKANVSAVSMPYGEIIEQTYETKDTIKVYAGNALKLTITAQDMVKRGQDYTVKFKLENVSDKSIYNLTFGITGSEQYKVIGFGGSKEAHLPITSTDYGDSFTKTVKELAPGGYLEYELTTTIWFNSALELVEFTKFGAFIDAAYYLKDISLTGLEGSTTSIPYDIVIERAERPNIIDKIVDDVVGLIYKDIVGSDMPGGSLGGTMIEVAGDIIGLDSTLVKGAKTTLKLMQGETNNRMYIKIDDGTGSSNSIYNDIVSITTGTDAQAVVDTLNGTKLTVSAGEVSIQAKGSGSTNIKVGVENKFGEVEKEWSYKINVSDQELKGSISVGKDSASGNFQVNENEFNAVISKQHNDEAAAITQNRYMDPNSSIDINLNGQTDNSKYDVTISGDSLGSILTNTATKTVSINGTTANLSFDRNAITSINSTSGNEYTIKAHKLDNDEATSTYGSGDPTYVFNVSDNNSTITDFGTGKVTVSVPYVLPSGINSDRLYVEHIKADGTKEELKATYDGTNNRLTFETDSFSAFRILVKPESSSDQGSGGGGGGGGATIPPKDNSVTNEDGSVTTTVKDKKTGTVTETTKYTDGTEIIKETKKDGTVIETIKNTDGSEVVKETKKDGTSTQTTKNTDGTTTVKNTAKNGTVTTTITNTDGAVTTIETTKKNKTKISVTVPEGVEKTNIKLPADLGIEEGTVSIKLTYSDKQTEIIKAKYTTGVISADLTKSATIEVLDDFKVIKKFNDVSPNSYYYDAVIWAIENDITTGMSDTEFSPEYECTRAQLVTFLWRAAGCPKVSPTKNNNFTDIAKNSYYYDAIIWAIENGITNGISDDLFAPDMIVTRGQVATFIYRYSNAKDVSTSSDFDDIDSNDYYYNAVNWAAANNITNGTSSNTFSPSNPCVRGQIVTFLYRLLTK